MQTGYNGNMTPVLALLVMSFVNQDPGPKEQASFTFVKQPYYFRYSKNNLTEYTPKGQSNLNNWKDMMTVNSYAEVRDAEALAKVANNTLSLYREYSAMIVKSDSKPRTEKSPAEHLIVAIFSQEKFTEISFARFLLRNGKGYSIVASHRIYGEKMKDEMSSWVIKNSSKYETELMAMPGIPKR